MKLSRTNILTHAALLFFLVLTFLPFIFVVDNAYRSNTEMYHSYFGLPKSLALMASFTVDQVSGHPERIRLQMVDPNAADVRAVDVPYTQLSYGRAIATLGAQTTSGFRYAWEQLRPYMINSLVVSISTVVGVVFIGSLAAYVFSRYRFPGHKALFLVVLSFMMIPGILTLVPSFLLVKKLGLLNSYWVMILPYVAGGQVMAIFLFKGFFDGLPEELFESARLDGASHLQQYLHIVLPLSKQIIMVVVVINILGTWNNFLWPFITNPDSTHHVVSSGLYLMSQTRTNDNASLMFSAYVLASLPLLILFLYATKPFISGVTSGAFKA